MQSDAVVVTLRNLPPALERQLVATAKARGWSLSRTVIRLLEERLAGGTPARKPGKDPIDALAGTWSAEEAAEFDRAIAWTRVPDPEMWE